MKEGQAGVTIVLDQWDADGFVGELGEDQVGCVPVKLSFVRREALVDHVKKCLDALAGIAEGEVELGDLEVLVYGLRSDSWQHAYDYTMEEGEIDPEKVAQRKVYYRTPAEAYDEARRREEP